MLLAYAFIILCFLSLFLSVLLFIKNIPAVLHFWSDHTEGLAQSMQASRMLPRQSCWRTHLSEVFPWLSYRCVYQLILFCIYKQNILWCISTVLWTKPESSIWPATIRSPAPLISVFSLCSLCFLSCGLVALTHSLPFGFHLGILTFWVSVQMPLLQRYFCSISVVIQASVSPLVHISFVSR